MIIAETIYIHTRSLPFDSESRILRSALHFLCSSNDLRRHLGLATRVVAGIGLLDELREEAWLLVEDQ